ncbi:MAG: hypothetical protein WDN49_24070 [Acetobacteraceae bacterium]
MARKACRSTSTPNPAQFVFGSLRSYVLVTWGLMLVVFLVSKYLDNSKTGMRLRAMRGERGCRTRPGNPHIQAAHRRTRGQRLLHPRSAARSIAQYLLLIDPDSVLGVDASLQMALMAVVGGIGSAAGPVLGTYLVGAIRPGAAGRIGQQPGRAAPRNLRARSGPRALQAAQWALACHRRTSHPSPPQPRRRDDA